MLARRNRPVRHGGFGLGLGDIPAAIKGTMFDPTVAATTTALATNYYEAVRTGQPNLAQSTLNQLNELRTAQGMSTYNPAVNTNDAVANQQVIQQHEQWKAQGLLSNTPGYAPAEDRTPKVTVQDTPAIVIPQNKVAEVIANTNPFVPPQQVVNTPQQVVNTTPTTTTNNSTPTQTTTNNQNPPSVTTHMLESGQDLLNTIRGYLGVLDPRNYIDDIANSTPDTWWIPGVPNWLTVAGGLGIVGLWMFRNSGDMGIGMVGPVRRVRR